MTLSNPIDPTKFYQINNSACKVLSVGMILSTGNNQQVIAAISGSVIRIQGWKLRAGAAGLSSFIFKSNSGGSTLYNTECAAATSEDGQIKDCGYFETTVSQGLFVDIGTTAAYVNVFYITYVP